MRLDWPRGFVWIYGWYIVNGVGKDQFAGGRIVENESGMGVEVILVWGCDVAGVPREV